MDDYGKILNNYEIILLDNYEIIYGEFTLEYLDFTQIPCGSLLQFAM